MSCKAGQRHYPIRIRKSELSETLFVRHSPVSLPPINLPLPNLDAWRNTNTGIPGVITHDTGRSGPECVIIALMHGNEFAGGHALERLRVTQSAPAAGRLTLILANLKAFGFFQSQNPLAARYLEEDMNRVWSMQRLRGNESSLELSRAREIEPFIRRADLLLDLHSTLWSSDPFFIAPYAKRSADFARNLATIKDVPSCVVTDLGHQSGARLIDYDRFAATVGAGRGCLLEAGQHWHQETLTVMNHTVQAFLEHAEALHLNHHVASQAVQCVSVTDNVVARSAEFAFTQCWRGHSCISRAGTLIARDGRDLIYTPYDDCILVVPNHRPRIGQLAVRLGRRTAS
ncbi:hypothetical protein D5366_10880 [Neokomagataea tanensis]|uniref:Succinylglutamate desuccinylase/Aspartoacylase catalytic domain-containing protein n=1 Tax=Neokomagataea tanensis TaxID=661191 RepID=A0A4Y6VAZ4_9PROT|nr:MULTISPECIES: succinylglutamate desuccinylase/aspartoacylase family protein [Neokomagataea]QDH25637.1 hypothetical protein D5366_10880 [Neokomagataea tanensis]